MPSQQGLNYSYWELRDYFRRFDLIVIGSGIVGLSTAISFKENNRRASILVLERGIFPNGASTKNAGFACFGSAGELLDDLEKTDEKTVWETVEMRFRGLALLRNKIGDKNMNYLPLGGFELFTNTGEFNRCADQIQTLNNQMRELLDIRTCYKIAPNTFGFKKIKGIINNGYEGQLDTGMMMEALVTLARKQGISFLNGVTVKAIDDTATGVTLLTNAGVFSALRVAVATNGFASQLLDLNEVLPARAQVLITSTIRNLQIRGTFHFDKGYYYFRNVEDRILFGGGRNLDVKGETTFDNGSNEDIHRALDDCLRTIILSDTPYTVEARWSGIMGVGKEKKPIIRYITPRILAAVRMGGMGIAIGSMVGEKAASMLSE